MAQLGPYALSPQGVHDSGLALLLVRPPRQKHVLEYKGGKVSVDPSSSLAVCEFAGASSWVEAVGAGGELINDCLDFLAMKGSENLVAREVHDEYFAWWNENTRRNLAIVTTATTTFSVGGAKVTMLDAAGNVIPPPAPPPLVHHPAFRFFRLAQTSEDLFEAFRNMYLAFELLLSTQSPKGRGKKEIDWLRDSLTAAEADLKLAPLVPPSTASPVEHILGKIYHDTRIQMFHAKHGWPFRMPASSMQDRAFVGESLRLLTTLVVRMAEVWQGTRRSTSGFFFGHIRQVLTELFRTARFVAAAEPDVPLDSDVSHPAFSSGPLIPGRYEPLWETVLRPHVLGAVATNTVELPCPMRATHLLSETGPFATHRLEGEVTIDGFDHLHLLHFVRLANSTDPRAVFQR